MSHRDNGEKICIDARALSTLSRTLSKLNHSGGELCSKGGELWSDSLGLHDVSDRSASQVGYSPREFHSRLDEIENLKSTRQALLALVENLDVTIQREQEELLPASRQHGLTSLPNEVIMEIFRHMLNSAKNYLTRFTVAREIIGAMSLVCRHFREIVLAFSEVWSYLDLNYLHGQSIELFLLRSKKEPLSVFFIYLDEYEKDILRVLEQKDRWYYLDARFRCGQRAIVDNHPPVVFPSVRRLRIHVSYYAYDHDVIFNHWTFPHAKFVELWDDLPMQSNPFDGDVLRAFTYDSFVQKPPSDMKLLTSLTRLLQPASSLRWLHLDVARVSYEDGFVAASVELPSVTEFSITNWRRGKGDYHPLDPPMPWQTFARIMEPFKMPNVRKLSVSIVLRDRDLSLARFVPLAFPTENDLNGVSELALNFMWYQDSMDVSPPSLRLQLEYVFIRFPALQSLSLDVAHCNLSLEHPVPPRSLEKLQSLDIDNYDGTWDDLYRLLVNLRNSGADLKGFTVRSRHVLNESALRYMFPSAEIRAICVPVML